MPATFGLINSRCWPRCLGVVPVAEILNLNYPYSRMRNLSNYICKLACVAYLTHNIGLILKIVVYITM